MTSNFVFPPPNNNQNRKSHSLESALEDRLIPLIEKYQQNVKSEWKSDKSLKDQERTLWNIEYIFSFAITLDAPLRRKPAKNIKKAIQGAIQTMKLNKINETSSSDIDSEFEFSENVPIVEVQQKNAPEDKMQIDIDIPNSDLATGNIDSEINAAENLESEESLKNINKRKQLLSKNENTKKIKKTENADGKWKTPSARLSDLGGIDGVIEEILQLIGMPLKHPEVYSHLGISPPRGVLFHGPPGCGKTMLANAIAGEFNVPFINISAPSIVSGMSGESEKKIREVFDEAKAIAPCILFIDEIDAITPKRETAQREMERRIVAQLLTCMDDISFEKTDMKSVIIIGATNRPDSLDPALRRAGRFDREISLGVPDENARARILEKMSSKLRLEGDFDFKKLAKLTPGYVGADLNALTSEAGMISVQRIFESMNKSGVSDEMDVSQDDETIHSKSLKNDKISFVEAMIYKFIDSRTDALTETELDPLCISHSDFEKALKKVQPSAKREGFATVPGVTWDDIGALEHVREELRMAVVEPVKHPEYFTSVGITAPMGVLLYGPPGCGKTLLAKAVASESHCNFISVKGPELLNKYVGESERAVRMVFARAAASAPCVIFFDELDALCPSRSNDSESQSSSRLVNTLLTEMDGMQGRKQVFVIAATNRPDMIDPAMLRPGRLDKTLYVDLPNENERLEILKTLTRNTPLHANVQLENIANNLLCDGLSGADLAALVREAAVAALRSTIYSLNSEYTSDKEIFVDQEHFIVAFSKISPSVSQKDRKRYELLKIKFGSASS